jgi:hypothetical protein
LGDAADNACDVSNAELKIMDGAIAQAVRHCLLAKETRNQSLMPFVAR